MKKILILLLCIIFMLSHPIYGQSQQYTLYGQYTNEHLTITSYSSSWNSITLPLLYQELLNNFHSDEFSLLSNIYIYPDSPFGINGYYYEDISINDKGEYILGDKAYIELYNGERHNTVEKIAITLSHEYGHHYTMCNIIKSEGKYYSDWLSTKYGKLRGFKKEPICYNQQATNYSYRWDIAEIAAEDYVQLLGSPTGKVSIDYPDVIERLSLNLTADTAPINAFNLIPQRNSDIPLACDIPGLYSYFLELGGYTSEDISLTKHPRIKEISVDDNKSYTIKWTPAKGNGPFEYTVIMYPQDNSFMPIPIKTVTATENLSAVFGNGSIIHSDGTTASIHKEYTGIYNFKIHIKDINNFVYSTKTVSYNFDKDKTRSYVVYPTADHTLQDVFIAAADYFIKLHTTSEVTK